VTICALVSDLMDRSRVSAAVPDVRFASTPSDCVGADVVVVDVGGHGRSIAEVRSLLPDARIVAFGRHDDPAALRTAEAAGADVALPRSRFFRDPAAALR
jgi:DNA-binding NarL/FixJ family response regulator